jgi:hypothetical protein
MSFTESYSNLIIEYKQKLRDQEESMAIFKNKLKYCTTVNQLNQYFAVGTIKPTQIKPQAELLTWSKYIYSFFK